MLGGMYADGRGVLKDDAEAVRWYRLAADQGLAVAQNSLGFMYANGEGVLKDDAEAVRWFRLAADQGDGRCAVHPRCQLRPTARAFSRTRPKPCAGTGSLRIRVDAGAQFNLGVMYANGEGVLKDEAEAVRWYRLAAEQGHAAAQFNLGNSY